MTGAFSAAPSWAETSLDWLAQNYPRVLGGRGEPGERLKKALTKANYALKECGDDRKQQAKVVSSLARNWSQEDHNELREFMDAGGYTPGPTPATHAANPATGLPPVVLPDPDGGFERVDLEMPPAEPSEELRSDPRFGSW